MAKENVQKVFNKDQFRIKFRAYFAVAIFIAVFAFLFISILSSTAQEAKYTEFLLGFLTASLLAVIINFYYGSGDGMAPTEIPGDANPQSIIPKIMIPEISPELKLNQPKDEKTVSPYNQ